jgi:ribonuclease HI
MPEYRGFVSGSEPTKLNRKTVWKMRRSELELELERRGIIYDKGKNRPFLTKLLLNEIPSFYAKKCSGDSDEQHGAPPPSNVCWAKYGIGKLDLDPKKKYTVAMKGVTQKDLDGTGIGIVLRDGKGTVVWVAQKYYPVPRAFFEAGYCAVVLAMRYVLSCFGLSNVVVQVADFTVYDQISGVFGPTKSSTLSLLRKEVFNLRDQYTREGKNVFFQFAPKAQRIETEQLALEALTERTSRNLGDENDAASDDSSYSRDPMDTIVKNALPKTDLTTLEPSVATTKGDSVIDPSKEYLLRFNSGESPPSSVELEIVASNVCWAKYDIEKLHFRANKAYTVAMKGVIQKDLGGTGIGIVLRDRKGTVVWVAQKYYPISRSLFEAGYSAVLLAMRYVLSRFGLSNVVVQIADFTIHDQISGLFDTTKLSLLLLREEIFNLRDHYTREGKKVVFRVASKKQRLETEQLAFQALIERMTRNLGDENDAASDDSSYSRDPMDSIATNPLLKLDAATFEPEFATVKGDAVIDPSKEYLLRFDGGSRGNPGIAGAGMVIYDDQEREIWHGRKYLGCNLSNNKAEYCAIHLGLNHARSLGIERICCEGDSELIIKQLQGVYKVKSENLRLLWEKTHALMNSFRQCEVRHIERKLNKRADALANEGTNHACRTVALEGFHELTSVLQTSTCLAMTMKDSSGIDDTNNQLSFL